MTELHIPTEADDLKNSDDLLWLAAKGTLTSGSGRYGINMVSIKQQLGTTDAYVGSFNIVDDGIDDNRTLTFVGTPAQILKAALQEFLLLSCFK
jgi:hypothetical protein